MPKKNPKHNSLRVQRKNQILPQGVYIPGGNIRRVPGWKSPQSRANSLHTQRNHLDILQTIESCIAAVYADHCELDDTQAILAMRALLRTYMTGSNLPPRLPPLASEIYAEIQQALVPRIPASPSSKSSFKPILDSLECVIDSAEFWHRQGGVRGYLEYLSQFL